MWLSIAIMWIYRLNSRCLTLLIFSYALIALGVYRHNDFTTTVNSAQESALLADFGNVLEIGGSTINIVPEIQWMKSIKNTWNVAFSSVSTLTRYVCFINSAFDAIFICTWQPYSHKVFPISTSRSRFLLSFFRFPYEFQPYIGLHDSCYRGYSEWASRVRFYRNNSNIRRDTYKPGSQAALLASLIQKTACQLPLWQMHLQIQWVFTPRRIVTMFRACSWIRKRARQLKWKQSWGRLCEWRKNRRWIRQWVSPSPIMCHINRLGFFWLRSSSASRFCALFSLLCRIKIYVR